jgi:hypothetical protein
VYGAGRAAGDVGFARRRATFECFEMPRRSRTVVLLGAQRVDPSLGDAVSALGVAGKIAIVTAGWQERELEDEELAAHLGGRTVNLRLHARADEVFRADPELAAAYRERQQLLLQRQDFYRIRLEHALEADHVIAQRRAPAALLDEESRVSLEEIRALDEWHLGRCRELHQAFEARWDMASRPAVARHRREIQSIIAGCEAVAIAGGHVATLVNRLSLFAIETMVEDRPLFAWSGGAMAICDRIVLFHDDPPQGPGASEVLDVGLGLASGVVVLPSPEQRLRLDRTDRVRTLVRRFAPAMCLALPARSHVTWQDGRALAATGVIELREDGGSAPFEPAREPAPDAWRREASS